MLVHAFSRQRSNVMLLGDSVGAVGVAIEEVFMRKVM